MASRADSRECCHGRVFKVGTETERVIPNRTRGRSDRSFRAQFDKSKATEGDRSGEEESPTDFQPSFQIRVHPRGARNAGERRRGKEEDCKNARGQNTQKAGSAPTFDGFQPPTPKGGRSR